MKRNIAVSAAVLGALAAALGLSVFVSQAKAQTTAVSSASPKIALGEYAPSVYGRKLGGGTVSLASYRGKYVLLVFWASWCSASRTEIPNVIAADRDVSGGKFAVVSYSVDKENTLDMLKDWVEGLEMKFPVIYDGKGAKGDAAVAYGVHYIPMTFMVDPKGRVIMKNLGGDSIPRIAKRLTEVGDQYKPIDATVTLVDQKPTADGLRVKVMVTNPEGANYDVRVEYEYTPKGATGSKFEFVPLKGQGTEFVGEAVLPIPTDATDVTVQAGVRSALLGEYVYGDFVTVGG